MALHQTWLVITLLAPSPSHPNLRTILLQNLLSSLNQTSSYLQNFCPIYFILRCELLVGFYLGSEVSRGIPHFKSGVHSVQNSTNIKCVIHCHISGTMSQPPLGAAKVSWPPYIPKTRGQQLGVLLEKSCWPLGGSLDGSKC